MNAQISKADIAKAEDAVDYHCEGLRGALFKLKWIDGQSVEDKRADMRKVFERFSENLLREMPDSATAQTPEPTSKAAAPKPETKKDEPTSPVDRLTKVVGEVLRADPKLSAEQAVTKAFEADPAAYDAIETERQAMIRRRGVSE